MKILTVCPSIHPDKFEDMAISFYNTSSEGNVLYEISTGTVTEAFNFAFKKYPDFDFYFMANDDIEFITPQWDNKLATKGKISYGNDLLQGENLCTFPMIDGNIVRALGWLQLPALNKYCGDVVWRTIGKSLDILDYHGSVFIKHHWSEEQVNTVVHEKDMGEFANWLRVSQRDINKVKEILK